MIVTMPSGAMRMKALSGAAFACGRRVPPSRRSRIGGSIACSSSPPPAAALAFRKERREGLVARACSMRDRHDHLTSAGVDCAAFAAFLIAARMRK